MISHQDNGRGCPLLIDWGYAVDLGQQQTRSFFYGAVRYLPSDMENNAQPSIALDLRILVRACYHTVHTKDLTVGWAETEQSDIWMYRGWHEADQFAYRCNYDALGQQLHSLLFNDETEARMEP